MKKLTKTMRTCQTAEEPVTPSYPLKAPARDTADMVTRSGMAATTHAFGVLDSVGHATFIDALAEHFVARGRSGIVGILSVAYGRRRALTPV